MDEIIKKVVDETGLPSEMVELVLKPATSYLVPALPYPSSALLQMVLNGDNPAALLDALYQVIKPPADVADLQVMEQVLNRGIPASFSNSAGESLLHLCAAYNRIDLAPLLITCGAEVNQPDRSGFTPLQFAVNYANSRQMVELLLEHGAKHDIFSACLLGDLRTVTLLVYEYPQVVHAREPFYQETPLFKAARGGHMEAVEVLLENGAEVDVLDTFGQSPLHIAAFWGHAPVVMQLLKAGTTVNLKSTYEGCTPLDKAWSRYRSNSPVIQLLRGHGAKRALETRSINYELFLSLLMDYYSALGFGKLEFAMTEDGSRIATLNVYPQDAVYFVKKVKNLNDEGAYEEVWDEIKAALFPHEQVRIRRISQAQEDVLDVTVEIL